KQLRRLCVEEGRTVIVVSHRLEEVFPYADEFVVMGQGQVKFHGSSAELMNNVQLLAESGMVVPPSIRFMRDFSERFQTRFPDGHLHVQDIADFVSKVLGGLRHAE